MGYYTMFNLEVRGVDGAHPLTEEKLAEIGKAFDEIFGEEDAFESLISEYYPEWKWYTCDYDLGKLSTKFPDVIFTLEGKGEDREDWWIAEYWNGNIQKNKAQLIPPSETFNWDGFS